MMQGVIQSVAGLPGLSLNNVVLALFDIFILSKLSMLTSSYFIVNISLSYLLKKTSQAVFKWENLSLIDLSEHFYPSF